MNSIFPFSEDPDAIRKVCLQFLQLSSSSTVKEEQLVRQHSAILTEDIVAALREAREEIQRTLTEVWDTYRCIDGVANGVGLPSMGSVQPGECHLLHSSLEQDEKGGHSRAPSPRKKNGCDTIQDSGAAPHSPGTTDSAWQRTQMESEMYALCSLHISRFVSAMLSEANEKRRDHLTHAMASASPALTPLPTLFPSPPDAAEAPPTGRGRKSRSEDEEEKRAHSPPSSPSPSSLSSSSRKPFVWYTVPEIVLEVLSYLPAEEILLHAEEVCTAWQFWLGVPTISRSFWLGVVQREFPELLFTHLISDRLPLTELLLPVASPPSSSSSFPSSSSQEATATIKKMGWKDSVPPLVCETVDHLGCAFLSSSHQSGVDVKEEEEVENRAAAILGKGSDESGVDVLCSSDWRYVAMLGVSQQDGVKREV